MDQIHHDAPSAESCCGRGRMMQGRQRYAEAANWYRRALEANPQHAFSHAMLSLCWTHERGREEDAVSEARRALALDPEESAFRSILAIALMNKAQDGQNSLITLAAEEAQEAVNLDSQSNLAYAVLARTQLSLRRYPEAEAAARQALALDTEDTMAAEALSIALRQQHKDEDNSSLINHQLRRSPEDASTHASAGWMALTQGDVKKANQHFLEALRLNPMSEGARQGLVESYRARSIVYRSYVRFCHFMSHFSQRSQTGILVGGFLVYRFAYGQLSSVAPGAAAALAMAWLMLVLWSHLARGVGSFFMLFDGLARRALRPREFWEGMVVGGLVFLALAFLSKALLSQAWMDKDAAIVLFLAAVPAAAAFSNHHYWGKWLYTGVAGLSGASALYFASAAALRLAFPYYELAFEVGAILGIAMTWVRSLGFAHD